MKLKTAVEGLIFFILIFGAFWIVKLSLKDDELPKRVQTLESMKKNGLSFSFQNLKGKVFNFNDFRGKIVLVNLWAHWCAPCVEELPSLINLAQGFPEKLIVIALTSESKEDTAGFISSFKNPGGNFIFAFSDQNIFSPLALPESYIFNADGKLALKVIGPRMWDSLDWRLKINQIFDQREVNQNHAVLRKKLGVKRLRL